MFEQISSRINNVIKKLAKKGKLRASDVKEGMKDIKRVLIEADVNLGVANKFVEVVEKESIGEKVLKSFSPSEMILKIVYEKMIELLGTSEPLKLDKSPSGVMLVGLQGSGKTTTAVKLAHFLKKKGKSVFLIPADVKRPAAFEQLKDLAEREGFPVFTKRMDDEVKLSKAALTQSVLKRYDTLVFDTAGRLHIDKEMINSAIKIKESIRPQEILLVVDGMTGQDAVNIASEFDEKLGITGIILTKMDGDTRGGAALSVRSVTGKPIKFIGVGEKPGDLEEFIPERLSSRILGMGDLSTLQEKAQSVIEAEKAKEFQEKLKKAELDLSDFLEQIKALKKMGGMDQLLELMPGGKDFRKMLDERALVRTEAIINSMTPKERKIPSIIDGSRKKRIARGSGTSVQDVNQLLKEYEMVKKLMKQMKRGRGINLPFPFMRGFS